MGPLRIAIMLLITTVVSLCLVCAPAAAADPSALAARAARFENPEAAVDRVLQLADQRLGLMPAVAAWKWQHQAAVTAPARERAVIEQAGRLGAQLGLSRQPVERLFALQVRLAREEESRLEQRWRARGYDYAGQPPSLQQVLRPQLDQLTVHWLQALYLAAPTLVSEDFETRYAPSAAERLQADGWSAAARRQLLEDLHAISAPAGPALTRIRTAGVLRIGTTGDYAPFSLDTNGQLRGADIELGQSLATAIGVRAVFVRTRWPELLQDLRAGRFDVGMGGISITPARTAAAAVSIPYYAGGKTILARCSDAEQLASLAALDRPQHTIIVNPGGTNEQFVRAHLHRARVRIFNDNQRIFEEILAHRADAMITDDVEVELQVRAHPGLCRTLAGTLTNEEKAVLMPRDDALVAAVNHWLQAELARGRPNELIQARLHAGPN